MEILDLLPFGLKEKLEKREDAKKVVSSLVWTFYERAFYLIVSVFISALVARYLGPEQYGTLNFIIAFTALFAPMSSWGIDSIVVRNIVREPEKKYSILGTVLVLKLVGGMLAFLIITGLIVIIRPNESVVIFGASLIGFGYVIAAFHVIDDYFQSEIKSKYTAITRNITLIVLSLIRVFLVVNQMPMVWFASLMFVETLLVSVGLLIAYKRLKQQIVEWRFSKEVFKSLLKDGNLLFITSVFVLVNMRIDQLLVSSLMDDRSLGIYYIAVKMTEILYFVPCTVVATLLPSIVKAKQVSEEKYRLMTQRMYMLVNWIAVLAILGLFIFGNLIVTVLFGQKYIESIPVLQVYIFGYWGTSMGVATTQYLTVENYQKIGLFRNMFAAIVNIGLNLALIPVLGIYGAAWASVVSYTAPVFFLGLFKSTRFQIVDILKSFNPLMLFRYLKSSLK